MNGLQIFYPEGEDMKTKLLCPKCKQVHQIEKIKPNGWVFRYCEHCGWESKPTPYHQRFREVIQVLQEDNGEIEP